MSKLLHRLNVLPISEPSCSGFQSKGSKHVKTRSSRFFFKLWCTKHPRNLCQNPGRICRSEESWSPSGRLVDAAAARRWDARLGDVAAVAGAGGGGGGGMSDPAHASKHPGHCCDCSSVAPANPCGLMWFTFLVFYVGFLCWFLCWFSDVCVPWSKFLHTHFLSDELAVQRPRPLSALLMSYSVCL